MTTDHTPDHTPDMDSVMRRIQKLLAMANDGRGDANEAATAAAMAEKLMRKFNIENADLLIKKVRAGDAQFATKSCSANMKRDDPRRPPLQNNPPWGQWLAYEVAKLNDCELRQGRSATGAVLTFMGFDSDVQVAAWMFDYLVGELIKGCKAFNKAAPRSKVESNSFRMGFVGVLQEKVREMRKEKDAEMQEVVASRALVVSKTQALVEHFGAFTYKESNSHAKVNGSAFRDGVAAGSKVDVGRRGVGSTSSSAKLLG